MTSVNDMFLCILFIALIVLVIFSIIICIKLLYTIDKTNDVLTDLEKKLKSVDGVFTTIDKITDTVSTISDSFVSKSLMLLDKIFKKKN